MSSAPRKIGGARRSLERRREDSRTLVTHGGERTIRFWNLATGTEVLTLNDADALWACPISPDGRALLWRRSSDQVFQLERVGGGVETER